MKYILLVWLSLSTTFLFSQESQTSAGLSFASGDYEFYNRWQWDGDEPDMKNSFQYKTKVSIKAFKTDDGKKCSGFMIEYGSPGDYKVFRVDQPVDMVCYFKSTAQLKYDEKAYECLYVNSKGIWLLHVSLDEKAFSVAGFFGKKGPSGKGIYKEIKDFIDKARPIQAEQLAALSEKKAEESKFSAAVYPIEWVSVRIISADGDNLKSDSEFEVGVVTTFENGEELSSKNLGGQQIEGEYEVTVKGADLVNGKYKVKPYCEDLVSGQYVEIEVVYFPKKNVLNNGKKGSRSIEVICNKNPQTIAREKAEDERIKKFKTDYATYAAKSPMVLPAQSISPNVVNDLTNVDTIYNKTEKKRNIALIREGDDYILLQTQNVSQSGNNYENSVYYLKKISKVDGKYKVTVEGTPYSKQRDNFIRASEYSQFMKTSNGYVLCSAMGLTFFNKDLNFDFHSTAGDFLMVNCAKLGDKDEFAILAAKKNTDNYYLTTYNATTKKYTNILSFGNVSSASSINTKLLYISDNTLLLAVNENANLTRYNFYKIDIEYLKKPEQDKFDNCEYFSASMKNRELLDMIVDASGKIMAVNSCATNDDDFHYESYVVNPLANTYREFSSTWITNKNYKVSHGNDYFKILPNGYMIVYGTGTENFQGTMTFSVFDRNFKQVGSFRLPTKYDDKIFNDEGYIGGIIANQFTKIMHFSDGETMVYEGLKEASDDYSISEFERYCYANFNNAVFDIYPGKTDNEIIVLTSTSIIKIDLSKSKPCTRKMNKSSSDSYSDSYDNSSDNSSSNNSNSSTGTKNNNSNSGSSKTNSSSGSSSSEKEFTGNVYFKYDMMGNNAAAERLYIHYGTNSAYRVSTTKGSSATMKCQAGKVYYSFTGEKKDMKEIMTLSVDDCGKTFKYTDFE